MSKRSKSKRFFQQSEDAMRRYDERFPYHETLAEYEERQRNNSQKDNTELGGL